MLNFILKNTSISSSKQLQSILYSILSTWENVYTIRNINPILEVFNLFFKKVLKNEFKDIGIENCSSNLSQEELSTLDFQQNNISTITTDILNAILKVLSSKDSKHQIGCLDCLISGLPCLKTEDSLLRICHLIWNPLVEKFKTKCPVTLYRCFQLLILLSSLAKDFLRQRTLW